MDHSIFWCHAAIGKPLQKSGHFEGVDLQMSAHPLFLCFFCICWVETCLLAPPLKRQNVSAQSGDQIKRNDEIWSCLNTTCNLPALKGYFQILVGISVNHSQNFKYLKLRTPSAVQIPPNGDGVTVVRELKPGWNQLVRVQIKSFFCRQLWQQPSLGS